MRARAAVVAVSVAAAAGLLAGGAPAAQARPSAPRAAAACTRPNPDDFDGDGCSDLATNGAGVEVFYGDSPTTLGGRRQVVDAPSPTALTHGDVDGDGLADLVVGLGDADVGGAAGAGEVEVVYGSPSGLGGGRASTLLREGTVPGTGTPETHDAFGTSVAVSSTGELAIGAREEGVAGVPRAGAVVRVRLRGTPTGSFVSQSGPVPGTPEDGDDFGVAVAWSGGDLVIGVPGQDVDGASAAGVVDVVPASGAPYAVSQDSPGMPGTAEDLDFFGSALQPMTLSDGVRVAIGVDFEDVGSVTNSGMVNFLQRRTGTARLVPDSLQLTQGTPGVVGADEPGDLFGQVLAESSTDGQDTLLVGVPQEGIGSAAHAGAAVRVVIGRTLADRTVTSTSVNQDTPGWSGLAQAGDRFGSAVAALTSTPGAARTEWFGVPDENIGTVTDRGGVQGGDGTQTLPPSRPGVTQGFGRLLS